MIMTPFAPVNLIGLLIVMRHALLGLDYSHILLLPLPLYTVSSSSLPPQPQTANEILSMLEIGNRNRTQHPTDANATSSRSHAVFQVCFIHRLTLY